MHVSNVRADHMRRLLSSGAPPVPLAMTMSLHHPIAATPHQACGLALLVTLCTSTTIAAPLRAQDAVRTPSLTERAREAFSGIAGVRELANGDVLVSEPESGTVWRVSADGARSNAVKSGNIGVPGRLYALDGDATLVFDRRATRFVVVRDGAVHDAPASLTPPPGPMRIGVSNDLYVADAQSRLYWLEGAREAASQVVRRNADGTSTTLASVRNPAMKQVREGAIGYSMSTPFAPVDDWALGADGSLVVVRAEPYHVERWPARGGASVRGAARVVTPVPVTAADRDANRQAQAKSMASINISGINTSMALPDDAYPTHKAPFVRDAARLGSDGVVYVHRTMPFDAAQQLVDVFGNDANWRESIALPARARIVSVGARTVYVAIPQGERVQLRAFAR